MCMCDPYIAVRWWYYTNMMGERDLGPYEDFFELSAWGAADSWTEYIGSTS